MTELRMILEGYVEYLDSYATSLTRFSTDIRQILADSQGKENEEQLIIKKAKTHWCNDRRLLKVFLDLEEEMGKRHRLSIPLNPEAGGSSIGERFNELPEPPPAAMAPKSHASTETTPNRPPLQTVPGGK